MTKSSSKHTSRFRVYKEYFILTLIVGGLVFLGFEMFGKLSSRQLVYFEVLEYATSAVFITDFIYELQRSPDKRSYIKHNWFYLLAAIPLPYAAADLLRSIRLIRVIKLLRFGMHYEYENTHSK